MQAWWIRENNTTYCGPFATRELAEARLNGMKVYGWYKGTVVLAAIKVLA